MKISWRTFLGVSLAAVVAAPVSGAQLLELRGKLLLTRGISNV